MTWYGTCTYSCSNSCRSFSFSLLTYLTYVSKCHCFLSADYSGHYIVVMDYDQSTDEFVCLNPSRSPGTSTVCVDTVSGEGAPFFGFSHICPLCAPYPSLVMYNFTQARCMWAARCWSRPAATRALTKTYLFATALLVSCNVSNMCSLKWGIFS